MTFPLVPLALFPKAAQVYLCHGTRDLDSWRGNAIPVPKLNLYREAGVREYWICDPQRERVLAYRFGTEAVMDTYAFSQTVPAMVFPGFEVNFGEIVARM